MNVDPDDLHFAEYWPPGSPDLVREFLRTRYDPATMPTLVIAMREDSTLALVGWEARAGEPGLLEAARGWALTENERARVKFLAEGGTG